jgi:hypothetical protein
MTTKEKIEGHTSMKGEESWVAYILYLMIVMRMMMMMVMVITMMMIY